MEQKLATNIDEVPKGEHWVILRNSSMHVPAEGVWAPGLGYPAHDEKFVTYTAYTDYYEFERHLIKSLERKETVKGIHVCMTYAHTVQVKVELKGDM